MALKTINDLTALTTPASTDLVGVWAVGAARMRKSTIAQTFSPMLAVANVFSAKQTMDALVALKKNVYPGTTSGYLEMGTDLNGDLRVQNDSGGARTLAGSISGGGTVATGGYTLTVPATGTAALLATANVFTAQQTVNLAADGYALDLQVGASNRIRVYAGSVSSIDLSAGDGGASTGNYINLRNNNNGSTPAAGFLNLYQRTGTANALWVDNTGVVRIYAGFPTNANDTAGTVVGAQTSHIDYKQIVGDPVPDVQALNHIRAAAAQVARFVYKSGMYNGQEFSGVVLDGPHLDRYGQDADVEHPAGKSLNIINAIGDLFLAVRHLENRLRALESVAG